MAVVAAGGTETIPGDGYKYHTFTSNGTLVVTTGGDVECLVIAGGGGGGSFAGGAGGAGGWQEGTLTYNVDGVSFTPAEYKIYCLLREIDKKLERGE